MDSLSDFEITKFTHDGATRDVLRKGSGPGVVVIHEVPGITPQVADFARSVADAGFTVALPDLFGERGRPVTQTYALGQIARACISHEFHVLESNGSSPITDWLRAYCRAMHDEIGGKGVGALGMCLTGNFALALAVDDCMMAPVLSQPSLPFPFGAERKRGLHLSDEALAKVKARTRDEGLKVVGLRFHDDPMCPGERFERLREELGDAFEGIELDPKDANPDAPKPAHSVVTNHLIDEEGQPTRQARDRVIEFFKERLV